MIANCKTLLACGWFVCLFVLLLLIYQAWRKGASCHPVLSATHLCPSVHSGLSPGMLSLLSRAKSAIKPSPVMSDHHATSLSWSAHHSYNDSVHTIFDYIIYLCTFLYMYVPWVCKRVTIWEEVNQYFRTVLMTYKTQGRGLSYSLLCLPLLCYVHWWDHKKHSVNIFF